MNRLTSLLAAATLALSACDSPNQSQTFVVPSASSGQSSAQPVNTGFSVAPRNAPSGPAVDAFARQFLDGIQARSITERREYCGYFFINAQGQVQGTPPRPGTFAGCSMPAPRAGQGIFASYHTHGAYGAGYDNEVPSLIDLASDFDFGIDGYVSTPGGRIWLIDFQTLSTRQICGLRCVTSDPGYVPQDEAGIQSAFSLSGLQRRASRF